MYVSAGEATSERSPALPPPLRAQASATALVPLALMQPGEREMRNVGGGQARLATQRAPPAPEAALAAQGAGGGAPLVVKRCGASAPS